MVLYIGYRYIYLRRNKYLPMWRRDKITSMNRIPGMSMVRTISVRRQATGKPLPSTTSDHVHDANGSDLIATDLRVNVESVRLHVDAVNDEPLVHPDDPPSSVLVPLDSPPATLEALDDEAYKALSKDQRRHRKLALMQMAADLRRMPSGSVLVPLDSPPATLEDTTPPGSLPSGASLIAAMLEDENWSAGVGGRGS